MDKIELKAPAKINLFLKVLNKRDDGYHNIYSWFQAVSLYDYLTYEKTTTTGMRLKHDGPAFLPCDDKNIIIKTARLLFEKYKIGGGLNINLQKNIPVSAGLGGGSSDSAATIYAIDKLFDLNLSKESRIEIGLKLGSDLPFFFSSGQAEITGRGEKVSDIKLPINYNIILVKPDLGISTAESYSGLKLGLTRLPKGIKLFCYKDFRELIGTIFEIGNDFEKGHFNSFPVLDRIKNVLIDAGADLVRMSGSGPTIYGLFENMPEGDGFDKIIRGDWQHFIVRPIILPAWER